MGQDYLEALAYASSGLVGQIVDLCAVQELEQLPIMVQGTDAENRTIAFLNELIFLIYSRKWLPKRVKLLQLCSSQGCNTLQGLLVGEPLDIERHFLKLDIKAITYHQFSLTEENGKTRIQFLCDL
jgi:SHS2 domain-containing protein